MAESLLQYITDLHRRSDLMWPSPPDPEPLKTTPFAKPISDIKVVTWNVYGTLLQIDQGQLIQDHEQVLRMQIALEKTIKEFNMWYSMTRKPGQPWEDMLRQYRDIKTDLGIAAVKKGEVPEIDSSRIWLKILQRLSQNEYSYDLGKYGDLEQLAEKVAYFFHASLQGVAATPHACETMQRMMLGGIKQGLLADGQVFTVPQLIHAFSEEQPVAIHEVLSLDFATLSYQVHVKKPSGTLFEAALQCCKNAGIEPEQVLHVSHNLQHDVAVAKKLGFKTALYAADKKLCNFTGQEVRDVKPDRLISDLRQVRDIVQV